MYTVVAFVDNVGSACSTKCAEDAVSDIAADYGEEADAGYEPSNHAHSSHCMGCGKVVA